MKKLLIAVSGGVDSMVLLHLLHTQGFEIGIIHINHLTRDEENKAELELVHETAQSLNIPFYYFEYKHKRENGNFHQAARNFRLAKYKEIVDEYEYDGVVLGHHKDDQIENILMKEKQISPILMCEKVIYNNLKIYRPLLNLYKEEIYKYAEENKIKYLEDSSNKTLKYKRNRYRAQISKLSNSEKEELYITAVTKAKEYTKIQNEIEGKLAVRDLKINDIHTIIHLHAYLRIQNITKNLSLDLLNYLFNAIKSKKNAKIDISVNKIFIISYGEIFIYDKGQSYVPIVDEQELQKGNNIFNNLCFEFNKETTNLKIRTAKPADKIITTHTKKINRFFIDEKIPIHLRAHWPLIVNEQNQIQYIPRKREVKLKKRLGDYVYE